MKIEAIPFSIVMSLVREILISACNTHKVFLKSIGVAGDYMDSVEEKEFPILATVEVEDATSDGDCGVHPWLLVWDEDSCEFHTAMRLDQEPDIVKVDKNKE